MDAPAGETVHAEDCVSAPTLPFAYEDPDGGLRLLLGIIPLAFGIAPTIAV